MNARKNLITTIVAVVVVALAALGGASSARAWDAGPASCKEAADACSGGKISDTVLDTQPKYLTSDCPAGSTRTAVSTCAHSIKWRGNTHLWIVQQALKMLFHSSNPTAVAAAQRMNDPTCLTYWEDGLWDADDGALAEGASPSVNGSHFFNPMGKDAFGQPYPITTYTIYNIDVGKNHNALMTAAGHISNIAGLDGLDKNSFFTLGSAPWAPKLPVGPYRCHELGLALHYLTDMTQPMHASGLDAFWVPYVMLHPVFEEYVPSVQANYPVNAAWSPPPATETVPILGPVPLSPDRIFVDTAIIGNGLAPGLMDTLKYRGTICTMNVEGLAYTGYCFVHDPSVDFEIGKLLQSAYKQTADYIYAVFKAHQGL